MTTKMKQCHGPCKRILPEWKFYARPDSPDGLSYQCMGCQKEYDRKRNRNLKQDTEYRHNMYPGQYDETLKKQNGECALPSCHCKENLVCDHNHKTRKFRAILCRPHNLGLGHFDDNSQLLREAADYLEKHK